MTLHGKVAIVTGGARGLGYGFASALAGAGARVTICDIRDEVEQSAAALTTEGATVDGILADVSKPDDVRRVVDTVVQRSGRIDILVNNAGVVRWTKLTNAWEPSLDDFERVMGTNLKGAWLFGRAVAPVMMAQRSGDIINISSDHTHTCGWPTPVTHRDAPTCQWATEHRSPGIAGMDVHDASKWALNGLTQSWAKELRDHNVRVNALCMGASDSPLIHGLHGYSSPEEVPSELRDRWLRPEDLSRVLLELLAEGPGGRSGDTIGLWVGHPVVLPPPSPVLDVSAWISYARTSD